MSGLIFKGGFAKLGNINVQPKPTETIVQTYKSVTLDEGSAKLNIKAPLDTVVDSMKSKNSAIINLPVFTILPAFRPQFPAPQPIDNRLTNRDSGSDVRFSAYEELTGVSRVRPEILFVTNFQPLFNTPARTAQERLSRRKDISTPGLNSVGEFLDAQIQLQHLRHEAMVKLIKDLKQDPDVAFELTDKENDFKYHISNLTKHVQSFYDIIDDIERLKLKLNIKNSPAMTYEALTNRYFGNILKGTVGGGGGLRIIVAPEFETTSLSNVSYAKTLSFLGYDQKNAERFSSTKAVLQSLYELQNILKGNSYNILGASTNDQKSDDSSVYINQHAPAGFLFDPTKVTTVVFDQLKSITKDTVLPAVNALKTTFDTLFASANFTSPESRIAYLFNFLSREFVFSRTMGSTSVQKYVSDTFGYPISDVLSNEQALDVIFGFFGDKITDRVDVYSGNSLANITQKVVDNVAVLPFEPDFIDFEENTFTPGSSYFLDQALQIGDDGKFNLTNLEDFSKDLGTFLGRFVEVVRSFGLLPTQRRIAGTNKSFNAGFSERMVHGRLLFEQVSESFINLANFQPLPEVSSSDALAVFTAADKDNYLKSLLFLYVLLKMYSSDSPTGPAAIEALIAEIDLRISLRQAVRKLTSSTVATSTNKSIVSQSRFGVSNISQHSMSTELKEFRNTSKFLNSFFNNFKSIMDSFQAANAMVNGHTRYGAVQDVVMMMITFDALLAVVSTYTPKTIQGKFTTRSSSTIGQSFYRFQIAEIHGATSAKNSLSFNTVRGKINFEVDAVAKIVFTILGSMTQLKDSIDGITKSLRMETKIKPINDVLAVLGNRRLLQMILNPQQIFLIKSLVDDINKKLAADLSLPKGAGAIDFELRGPGRDDIALLDDSIITQGVKKTLMAFFSNEKFSSQKGHNIRLLTVGVPMGFSQKLKERVKLEKVSESSYNSKQVDVVKINVYKVDVEHQDIIFKPQTFLFELSRFVNRTGLDVADVSPGMALDKILSSIETRDYSLETPPLTSQAGSDTSNLSSTQYSFLTSGQKTELTQNHVISYLLELYIRLLTGVSVSEYDLYVDPSEVPLSTTSELFMERVVTSAIAKATKVPLPLKTSTTGVSQFKVSMLIPAQSSTLPPLKKSNITFKRADLFKPLVAERIKAAATVVETTKRARTVFSDNLEESKRIFLPKAFDRVFNVAVDPDDFEIDVEETLKTPSGRDAFDKLLRQGVIVGSDEQSAFFAAAASSKTFRIRERDINENDLTFEKYFVTIDTVMDEVV